jgi:hypothetical protein
MLAEMAKRAGARGTGSNQYTRGGLTDRRAHLAAAAGQDAWRDLAPAGLRLPRYKEHGSRHGQSKALEAVQAHARLRRL